MLNKRKLKKIAERKPKSQVFRLKVTWMDYSLIFWHGSLSIARLRKVRVSQRSLHLFAGLVGVWCLTGSHYKGKSLLSTRDINWTCLLTPVGQFDNLRGKKTSWNVSLSLFSVCFEVWTVRSGDYMSPKREKKVVRLSVFMLVKPFGGLLVCSLSVVGWVGMDWFREMWEILGNLWWTWLMNSWKRAKAKY